MEAAGEWLKTTTDAWDGPGLFEACRGFKLTIFYGFHLKKKQ
jgi:hypothetical protein